MGSSEGINEVGAGQDTTNTTWTFPSGTVKNGENVVTLVLDQTGLEEDYYSAGTFRVSATSSQVF